MTQPEKSDYIIDRWSKFFGVDKVKLKDRSGARSPIWSKKRYLVLALHDNTAYNNQEIANMVGYRQRNNVTYHINTLREELSDKMYGQDNIKRTYDEFITYLNL